MYLKRDRFIMARGLMIFCKPPLSDGEPGIDERQSTRFKATTILKA